MRKAALLTTVLFACSAPVAPPARAPLTVEVGADGAVSLRRDGVALETLTFSATVSGEVIALGPAPTQERSLVQDALGAATQLNLVGGTATTQLSAQLRQYPEMVTVELTARCPSGCPGARVEGFRISAQASSEVPAAWTTLVHGYSSWAPTYTAAVQRASEPTGAAALTGNNHEAFGSDARVSWWVSALTANGPAVVAGALTAARWKTRVLSWREGGTQLAVVSGGTFESVALSPQGVTSERYLFSADVSARQALSGWAEAVARLTPSAPPPFAPVGWNSWNTLFEGVTEQKALDNADRLLALGLEANNVQLDDGWQQAWGTWTPNAKFPAGLDGLSASLAARGLRTGVWLAPFLVDETAKVAIDHPTWFVKDTKGRTLSQADFFAGRVYLVLDATHPEAHAWLLGEVRRVLSQGVRYLKLDFLYAGAVEGVRHADVTALEAYRSTMAAIFAEAQGAQAYVLACGAPVLPSAGVAHGLRTSGDIAGRSMDYTFEWVKSASRNVGARWFVNRFLANDADTILIRGLPDGVKRQQVTTNLLAGRILGVGDDLTALTADETAFLTRAAALPAIARLADPGPGFFTLDTETPRATSLSQAESLVDADSYGVPSVWVAPATSEGTLVGIFNWSQQPTSFTLEAKALGLTGTERAEELWSAGTVPSAGGAFRLTVPGRDVAYLRFKAQ